MTFSNRSRAVRPSVRPSVVKVKTTRRRLARVGVRPAPVPRPRSIVRPRRSRRIARSQRIVRSIDLARSIASIHPSIARIHPSVDLAVSTRVVRSFGRSVETVGRSSDGNKTKKRRDGWTCVTTTTCRTSEMRFSFSRRRSDNRKTLGHSGKDGRAGGRLGRTARECDARGCPGDDARRDARRPRTRMRPRSEPTRRTTTPRRRRRNDRRDRRMTCVRRRRGDRRTRFVFPRVFRCLFVRDDDDVGGGFSTSRAATSANGFPDRGRGGESVNIFFVSFV